MAIVPPAVEAAALAPPALAQFGVVYLPGDRCDPDRRGRFRRCVRLCFACVEREEALAEGVARLAAAVRWRAHSSAARDRASSGGGHPASKL